jgi:hypothetical protein
MYSTKMVDKLLYIRSNPEIRNCAQCLEENKMPVYHTVPGAFQELQGQVVVLTGAACQRLLVTYTF